MIGLPNLSLMQMASILVYMITRLFWYVNDEKFKVLSLNK